MSERQTVRLLLAAMALAAPGLIVLGGLMLSGYLAPAPGFIAGAVLLVLRRDRRVAAPHRAHGACTDASRAWPIA